MAASEGKADAQTRIFDFPELTSAYEGKAEAKLHCIEYFQRAAFGQKEPFVTPENRQKETRRSGLLMLIW